MSSADRIIRILIAVVVITLYYMNEISGAVAIVLLAIAGIFILTSFISFCPIYGIFGISSLKKKKSASN